MIPHRMIVTILRMDLLILLLSVGVRTYYSGESADALNRHPNNNYSILLTPGQIWGLLVCNVIVGAKVYNYPDIIFGGMAKSAAIRVHAC